MALPADLAAAEYRIWVHNGHGGAAGWREAGTVAILPHPPAWKETVFNLADFGARGDDEWDDSDPLRAALAAAEANGGGVVQVPRGRFFLEGTFAIPPHVLLKGAGRELSHLSWPDMAVPPEVLLSGISDFGIEDLSIFTINYNTVVQGGDRESAEAGNIFLRRVAVRATSLTRGGTGDRPTAEMEASRRAVQTRGIALHGRNVQVTDCDLVARGVVLAVGGSHTLVARNRLHSDESGWSPVSGTGHIVEDNEYLYHTTGATGCSQFYFARNRIQHNYRGFREGFTADGIWGGPGFLKVGKVDGNVMTMDKPVMRQRQSPHTRWAIHILEGPGAGQYRRVESFTGNTIVLDRPWDVPPDETSMLSGANFMGQWLIVDNDWSDTGIAFQSYGSSSEIIASGNTSARSGGFRFWGRGGHGPCPSWYTQGFDNEILEGYGTMGPEMGGGYSSLSIVAQAGSPGVYSGNMARGVVLRNNVLHNNAPIHIQGPVLNAVIENNLVRNAERGITGGGEGVLMRGNRFEAVKIPMPSRTSWWVHPAEAVQAGMSAVAADLKSPPPAWKEIEQQLASLAGERMDAPDASARLADLLRKAVASLAAGRPDGTIPVSWLAPLLGLEPQSISKSLGPILVAGTGGEGVFRQSLFASAWSLPVTAEIAIQAPPGWKVVVPPAIPIRTGGIAHWDVKVSVPAGHRGRIVLPMTYQLEFSDNLRLTLRDELILPWGWQQPENTGISDWLVLGPFPPDQPPRLLVSLLRTQYDSRFRGAP